MPASDRELLNLQREFAATIRDPDNVATPAGVPENRMDVYRELFFSNVAGGLRSAFPVVHELFPERCESLARAFWREHRSHTPEFPRLAGEFLNWLDQSPGYLQDDPAWLFELLVWEHAELEAMLELDDAPSDSIADLLELELRLTRSLRIFAFDYPVHKISSTWQPEAPETTFLACYRTPQDCIDFIELTAPSAALLESLQNGAGATVQELLATLARQMDVPVDAIQGFALEFLDDCVQRHVVVGAGGVSK